MNPFLYRRRGLLALASMRLSLACSSMEPLRSPYSGVLTSPTVVHLGEPSPHSRLTGVDGRGS